MRPACCFGNWKMHLGVAQSEALAHAVAAQTPKDGGPIYAVTPSPLALYAVARALAGRDVEIIGQSCHWAASGAHTGFISAEQLRDAGATRVLVGHSERRLQAHESPEDTEKMVEAAERADLGPVICVGESLKQREAQQTLDVVVAQLMAACARMTAPERLVVAYEPVWAIGTGRTAAPSDADQVCGWLRDALQGRFGSAGDSIPLLYGGSVNDACAAALAAEPNIDGFLVGGASLDAEHFGRIGAALS